MTVKAERENIQMKNVSFQSLATELTTFYIENKNSWLNELINRGSYKCSDAVGSNDRKGILPVKRISHWQSQTAFGDLSGTWSPPKPQMSQNFVKNYY